MARVHVDACHLARKKMTLTVHLTGMQELKVRLWLTVQVLRLLSWVAPFDVEVRHG